MAAENLTKFFVFLCNLAQETKILWKTWLMEIGLSTNTGKKIKHMSKFVIEMFFVFLQLWERLLSIFRFNVSEFVRLITKTF